MFDSANILDNENPIVIFHHGMKILGPIFHESGTRVMRKLLTKKGYSTVLYYRRASEVQNDYQDFHDCIRHEPWKHRKMILIGHSSGACYIRYLRKHPNGLHFLKSIALDGSFLYETIEYFLHIPNDEIQFNSDAAYHNGKSLREKLLKIQGGSTDTDCEENDDWYSNMYRTRKPVPHHIWYNEKPELAKGAFQIKREKKDSERHVQIYARKYSHTLHPHKNIAKHIVEFC
jgi:hypothetical protein